MGSSLIFVAVTSIVFAITFGLVFLLIPVILGSVMATFDQYIAENNISPEWAQTHREIHQLAQYILPLIMALGMTLLVLKVLMIASARGYD